MSEVRGAGWRRKRKGEGGRGRRRNDVESHLTISRFHSAERRMLNVRTSFVFSSNT